MSQEPIPNPTASTGARRPFLTWQPAVERPAGTPSHQGRWLAFAGIWLVSTVALGWMVLASQHVRQTSTPVAIVTLVLLLACTASLLFWLGRPATGLLNAAATTRRVQFALVIAATVLVLFPPGIFGPAVLLGLAVLALGVLLVLRPHLSRREAASALALAVIAAIGGLVDWWGLGGGFSQFLWAALQLPLVLLTLLAGWSIARRVGWIPAGIGPSRLLSEGVRPALRSFLFGVILSLPWTLGNLLFRAFEGDTIRTWWQPLSALQPAVAEEAWGRVFLIPLLYLVFRRFARAPAALLAAVLIGALWFAFLHVPLDPLSTVLLFAVFVLPITSLWLRRDLETAIGFHFCADFVRFVAAYLFLQGLWFK